MIRTKQSTHLDLQSQFFCFSNYKNIHAGDIVHFFWPKCKSSLRRTGQNIPSFHWSPTKSTCANIKHSKEYEDKVEKIRELKRRSIPKSNFSKWVRDWRLSYVKEKHRTKVQNQEADYVWPSRCMSKFVVIFDSRFSQEGTPQCEGLFSAWNWPFSQQKHFINQIKTKVNIFFINSSYV